MKLYSKKSVLEALVLLFIFLVPLIGTASNFGFEQSKILFFIFSISLIGLLWLGKGLKWSKIQVAGAVFIVILLLTSLVGVNLKASLLGSEPYFQGWVVYVFLWLFALIVATLEIKFERWVYILTSSSVLVAILAIRDWVSLNIFHQQILAYAGRVVSTFGQPNFYSGFLLLALPFSYFLFKTAKGKGRYFGFASGLVSLIGILVSYSRSTILLALMLLLLGLMNELRIKFKVGIIIGVVVLGSIALALVVSSGLVGNEVSRPILTANPDLTKESVEKRVYIWPQVLKIAWQKPLTGYGLENIGQAVFGYFEDNKHSLFEENLKVSPVLLSLKELNIDRSHNYLLDLLLFSGILGLLGWLGLVGVLFQNLRQKYNGRTKNVLLVSLITYLVWVQFQNQSIVHLVYFWLMVGLMDQ